ncbi:helix-turn-helix domain-containing protein [Muricoccus radiodurans]|uniref:helix-turn-helix domain-containing protein n=1 Tax=Muricoccus radiodurans TaxID=2231721 RepID=UPI003CED03D4
MENQDPEIPPMLALIESRLERLDLSAEAACRAAGLPPDYLVRMREGTAPVPRGNRLVRLAETLGTSVSYLVGLDPDTQPPPEVLEEDQGSLGLLAGDEEALLRAYRDLDFPTKAALLTVVRKMAGPEPVPDAPKRRK